MYFSSLITVTTAGTRVALGTTGDRAVWVSVQASPANGGIIALGGSNVTTSNGIVLNPGEEYVFPEKVGFPHVLGYLYADAAVNGSTLRVLRAEQ